MNKSTLQLFFWFEPVMVNKKYRSFARDCNMDHYLIFL